MEKSSICISSGDPSGIGVEIIVKSLSKLPVNLYSQVLIIGELWLFKTMAKNLDLNLKFQESSTPVPNGIAVHSLHLILQHQHTFGVTNSIFGSSSFFYFKKAIELCQTENFHGLVTAPICKKSLNLAGFAYRGHTDILEKFTRKETIMTILHPKISVAHVTDHVPLKIALNSLTPKRIIHVCYTLYNFLKKQGIEAPKIAMAGINPHAGESGILGTEEQEILIPIIQKLKTLPIQGPYSADTLFYRALQGEFHGIIAMYHDQGFIPMKTIDFQHSVNCTLGIPFVRTSPDHGTAFDLAGKNKANESSMLQAILWAFRLSNNATMNQTNIEQ